MLAAQLWPVTLRLCLSVTLMSEWQEGLPSLIMIHTLKLKQLESSTDVSTMRSDVLLQHVTSHVKIVTHFGEKGCLAATSRSHGSVVSACFHVFPPHTHLLLCVQPSRAP